MYKFKSIFSPVQPKSINILTISALQVDFSIIAQKSAHCLRMVSATALSKPSDGWLSGVTQLNSKSTR